jgi:RNA polymerase sigma-70 factor (ECF subfamily)
VVLSLFDAHVGQVYSYFLRRCGERSSAEDLTSETVLSALVSLQRSPPRSADAAWLIGIARHKLVDHWRRREREHRIPTVAAVGSGDVEPPWEQELEAGRAIEVLEKLMPHHRLVLTLRYLDDLSVPEIAAHLDRSVHAAESLLARARGAFREAYGAEHGGGHGH